MKKHIQTVLEMGLLYAIIIVVLDFILKNFPILIWLSLGVAFSFFAVLIFDLLLKFLPKTQPRVLPYRETNENDLSKLGQIVEKAFVQRDAWAAKVLSDRLKSLALSASAYRANRSGAELIWLSEHDEQIARILVGNSTPSENNSLQALGSLLSKIESWIA
jgi:hypothetical protein